MAAKVSDEVLREERVRPPMHPGHVLELEFLARLRLGRYGKAEEWSRRMRDSLAADRSGHPCIVPVLRDDTTDEGVRRP